MVVTFKIVEPPDRFLILLLFFKIVASKRRFPNHCDNVHRTKLLEYLLDCKVICSDSTSESCVRTAVLLIHQNDIMIPIC